MKKLFILAGVASCIFISQAWAVQVEMRGTGENGRGMTHCDLLSATWLSPEHINFKNAGAGGWEIKWNDKKQTQQINIYNAKGKAVATYFKVQGQEWFMNPDSMPGMLCRAKGPRQKPAGRACEASNADFYEMMILSGEKGYMVKCDRKTAEALR